MELRIIGTPEEIADALHRLGTVPPTSKKTKKRKSKQVNETGSYTFTIEDLPRQPTFIPSVWYPQDPTTIPQSEFWRTITTSEDDGRRLTPFEYESTGSSGTWTINQ